MRTRRRGDRGAVAVEAAIVLSLVVIPLMCGIISYGVMLTFRAAMSQAASEGARAAVGSSTTLICSGGTSSFSASACPGQYYALQAVNAQLQNDGYSCTSTGMTCTIQLVQGGATGSPAGCVSGHYCAVVTLSYAYSAHPRVWMPFMSGLLPSNLSFTSMVQVS